MVSRFMIRSPDPEAKPAGTVLEVVGAPFNGFDRITGRLAGKRGVRRGT